MLGTLTTQEIETLLESCILGRIGCTDGKRVYVVPVNYVYDGRYIIAHSREGLKIDMMRKNPRICFEVEEVKDLAHWRSVVVQGHYEELLDEEDKYYAMKKMVDRMLKLKVSQTARPPHLAGNRVHPHQPGEVKAVVFRIGITEKTGRFEQDAPA